MSNEINDNVGIEHVKAAIKSLRLKHFMPLVLVLSFR